MNFSEFLIKRKNELGLKTTKDHYDYLGGEETLGVSLRHFREIESGNHTPSEAVLNVVFSKTPNLQRRSLIQAYFKTVFPSSVKTDIHQFLEQSLLKPPKTNIKSIWDTDSEPMEYSWDQLNYLSNNEQALLFHKHLMLFDKIELDKVSIPKETLEKLNRLNLVDIRKKVVYSSSSLYRLPMQERSTSRLMSIKHSYILKNIDLFLKRDGDPDQVFDLDTLIVTESAAKEILNHMKSLKQWVKSLAIKDHEEPNKPFIFSTFARILGSKDF